MMSAGSTMLCFAHLAGFPERKNLFQEHGINVIAMEEILESPETIHRAKTLGGAAMRRALQAVRGRKAKSTFVLLDTPKAIWAPFSKLRGQAQMLR